MAYSLKFSIPSNYEEIWLIGLRIDPDLENYNFFTLLFIGDIDIPLTIDNYIVLFNDLIFLSQTIKTAAPEINKQIDISEIETVDIAQTLYLIQTGEIDNSATIVNSLNIILDLVRASGIKMFQEDRTKIFNCADYFTFNKVITDFFVDFNVTREEIMNIILWCVGAIISKSKFVRKKMSLRIIEEEL